MKIKSSEMATNAGGWIPEMLYRVRCIGTAFTKENSSKQPMTTLKCEIIDPEKTTVDGKEVVLAGRPFQMFLIHNVSRTGWASQEQVMEFCKKLGIETGVDDRGEPEYDTDLHKEYYHGMEWDMVLSCEEQIRRHPRQPGEKEGKPILDGEGKEISMGFQVRANPSDVPENPRATKNADVAAQPY